MKIDNKAKLIADELIVELNIKPKNIFELISDVKYELTLRRNMNLRKVRSGFNVVFNGYICKIICDLQNINDRTIYKSKAYSKMYSYYDAELRDEVTKHIRKYINVELFDFINEVGSKLLSDYEIECGHKFKIYDSNSAWAVPQGCDHWDYRLDKLSELWNKCLVDLTKTIAMDVIDTFNIKPVDTVAVIDIAIDNIKSGTEEFICNNVQIAALDLNDVVIDFNDFIQSNYPIGKDATGIVYELKSYIAYYCCPHIMKFVLDVGIELSDSNYNTGIPWEIEYTTCSATFKIDKLVEFKDSIIKAKG